MCFSYDLLSTFLYSMNSNLLFTWQRPNLSFSLLLVVPAKQQYMLVYKPDSIPDVPLYQDMKKL